MLSQALTNLLKCRWFKNNNGQDHFLPQESGCLSTALEAEGTFSSPAEVSFDQILGTCGSTSGSASALSTENNVKRSKCECGEEARGRSFANGLRPHSQAPSRGSDYPLPEFEFVWEPCP